MRKTKRYFVEKWTNLFCAIYSIPSPILDMAEVIERFGGTVAEIPGSYSLNGNIIKSGDSIIFEIAGNETPIRKKYNLACLLGHAILQLKYEIDPTEWEKATPELIQESMFNADNLIVNRYFAEALLMPEKKVRELTDEGLNIKEMAEYFHVSKAMMTIRLKTLN